MEKSILKGMGISGEDVKGEAIVIKSKKFEKIKPRDVRGKIIVTTDTTPELTPLFLLIKGIVTENGAVLSHAAIVSREFNVPCIIGVKQAMEKIKTGEEVKLVITNGEVIVKKQNQKQ